MNRFVMDASVAVKWLPLFAHEPLAAEAKRYLQRWSAGEITLLVPDLFWPEVASVLWKSVRKGLCRPEEAEEALLVLQSQALPTFPSLPIVDLSLGLAMQYGRTVYDTLYVALAVDSRAQLITADEKLANALAAHLPVKWLGAL